MACIRFLVQLAKRCWFNYYFRKNHQDNLKKVLFRFERFLKVERGLGEVTVEGYLKMIKKFIKDTGRIYPSREHIFSYLLALHTKKLIQPYQEFLKEHRMVHAVSWQSNQACQA